MGESRAPLLLRSVNRRYIKRYFCPFSEKELLFSLSPRFVQLLPPGRKIPLLQVRFTGHKQDIGDSEKMSLLLTRRAVRIF